MDIGSQTEPLSLADYINQVYTNPINPANIDFGPTTWSKQMSPEEKAAQDAAEKSMDDFNKKYGVGPGGSGSSGTSPLKQLGMAAASAGIASALGAGGAGAAGGAIGGALAAL